VGLPALTGAGARTYERHKPEDTVLYRIVAEHLETFLAEAREKHERGLPDYVEKELREYLKCGIYITSRLVWAFGAKSRERPARSALSRLGLWAPDPATSENPLPAAAFVIDSGGRALRILTDSVGNPRLVVDSQSGAIVKRLSIDEFGNTTADTAPDLLSLRYSTGIFDPDLAWVRLGTRDYEPLTGRWTTADVVAFDGTAANPHGYQFTDPINSSDPQGTGPLDIAQCLLNGYSASQCFDFERQLACKNWASSATATIQVQGPFTPRLLIRRRCA